MHASVSQSVRGFSILGVTTDLKLTEAIQNYETHTRRSALVRHVSDDVHIDPRYHLKVAGLAQEFQVTEGDDQAILTLYLERITNRVGFVTCSHIDFGTVENDGVVLFRTTARYPRVMSVVQSWVADKSQGDVVYCRGQGGKILVLRFAEDVLIEMDIASASCGPLVDPEQRLVR